MNGKINFQKGDVFWIITIHKIIEFIAQKDGIEALPNDSILCYKNDEMVYYNPDMAKKGC